jgi:adenylate kinase
MVVVVTGTVGLDKKSYLQKVCELAAARGQKVLLCNVGERMYDEALDIPRGRILDIPLKRLHLLRRSVFKDIIAKAKTAENLIVNTHATFRWRHGLFAAFDFDQMRQLGADMYICLVDGVDNLHVRLSSEHLMHRSLKDLLVWREEELFGTELLCKSTNESTPFYCLSRGNAAETVQTFYELVFSPQRKKAYLSFPMTHVVDMPQIKAQIQTFRNLMKQLFICFDPGDLEEAYLPYYAQKAAAKGEDFVEVTALGQTVRFALREVQEVEQDINSQIYARDFLLIDQSNMIISFIPELAGGRAVLSSGVERELQHAHEAAKEVYVVWTARTRPSVFVTQTATKVFQSLEIAAEFFRQTRLVVT